MDHARTVIVTADAQAGHALMSYLQAHNYPAVTTSTPVDAVVQVARHRPDLVLIDGRADDGSADRIADLLRDHEASPTVVVLSHPRLLLDPDLTDLLPNELRG